MPVRDLLWGCPICRTPGAIRPAGRTERCRSCAAAFRRGAGARIEVAYGGRRHEHPASHWIHMLGPVESPVPSPDGTILGPEPVRVKLTRHQKPLRFGEQLLGWVEMYDRPRPGSMSLRTDGLHFLPAQGQPIHWAPADLSGIQPASSSLQLSLRGRMASVRFLEGSVRLWTRAVSDVLHSWHQELGREVFELQPCIRTRPFAGAAGAHELSETSRP